MGVLFFFFAKINNLLSETQYVLCVMGLNHIFVYCGILKCCFCQCVHIGSEVNKSERNLNTLFTFRSDPPFVWIYLSNPLNAQLYKEHFFIIKNEIILQYKKLLNFAHETLNRNSCPFVVEICRKVLKLCWRSYPEIWP